MENVFKEHADTRLLIKDELRKIDHNAGWLAKKCEIDRTHLYRILRYERQVTQALLDRINKALQTDFPLRNLETPPR